ncbi:arginase family protein [Microbacterium koreense]|uniref:Arginase family protein n=1 Tax=Microbacterium koreense TaxID=323761 RepID=A0ABW2ZUJ1_9MICO
MTHYLVVPQWQGSPSARAMQLIDGAEAIAGDLPRAATTILDVPAEAGDALGTSVHRLSSLQRVREQMLAALEHHAEPVLTIGGDGGVALTAIEHAIARHPGLAVVWLNAHPALNDPESTPSGAFAGMALRAALGDGVSGLSLAAGTLTSERTVIAGARAFDEAELDLISRNDIRSISVDDLRDPQSLAEAVTSTGAAAVYAHVGLDVLDPAELAGTAHPEPFGATVADVTAALGALRATVPLVGASLTGYSPASPSAANDDLGPILRLIGALA